jgi:hypothetical protein
MPDGTHGGLTVNDELVLKKIQTFGFLEKLCEQLDLTDTQRKRAEGHYYAAGGWLAEATDPLLQASEIYVQGSTATGTNVRPLASKEHDVDLISLLVDGTPDLPPAYVKKLIGDRLKASGRYRDILEEKQRCWRLVYANEFHLDITPAIPNPDCFNGGELVPDKVAGGWKASNPRGFRDKFIGRGKLMPSIRMSKAFNESRVAAAADSVEAFPVSAQFKGVLRRAVQILKRHRDVAFQNQDKSLLPLSVIITQLASQSYEYCVRHFVFDNELDLLVHTVKFMTMFIEKQVINGRTHYFVWNETTEGENFAEKWNDDPGRALAFFRWHKRVELDLARLADLEGMDELTGELAQTLGEGVVRKALDDHTGQLSAARGAGRLGLVASVGLSTSAAASPIRSNTFFGR